MSVLSFVSNSSVSMLRRGGRRRNGTPARKPPRNRLGMECWKREVCSPQPYRRPTWCPTCRASPRSRTPTWSTRGASRKACASPFWISDNNAGVSTLYEVPGASNTPVSINPLVVSIPTPGDPLGAAELPPAPCSTSMGATGGFTVSGVDKNGNPITAAANFLFVTADGTLVGWNPAVNPVGFDPVESRHLRHDRRGQLRQ